jgi:hypothetical protein
MRCAGYKRVRTRSGKYVKRCAKYKGGSPRSRSSRSSRGYRRRGHGRRPYNKGRKCVQMGVNRRGVGVCRSYGARPRMGRHLVHGPMMASGAFYNVPRAPLWTR